MLGFLETITLDTEVSEEEQGKEVSMMTIHGSKGLEYPYVFVSGVEESLFPSFQSLENGEEAIEEERRLFYVAMTRAMKKLFILFAQGRMLWGSVKFNGPSRFISEIPEEYYDWKYYGKSESNRSNKSFDDFNQSSSYGEENTYYVDSAPKKKKAKFEQGSKIKHKLYGEGKVIDTNGIGADEKVTILFKNGAKKKFMVKFAPLERVH